MPWPMDQASAQRWFAVEFNNEAWNIIESPEKSPDQMERLVHLAHAACLHWSAVGDSLHRQRALDLLAHAYAAAGRGEQAVDYAEQARRLSEQHGDKQTPFDRAEACATMAVALAAAGRRTDAEPWRSKATEASKDLDADDRSVINRILSTISTT
jgi:tetratricopeptide (TPR) repeat protein